MCDYTRCFGGKKSVKTEFEKGLKLLNLMEP